MSKHIGDKPELLTKDEMDRLISVVAGDLYFTTLYKVLRYSGRRTGEIVGTKRKLGLTGGIRLWDINFKEGTAKTVILKTKKRRVAVECKKCKKKTTYKNRFCPSCGSDLPVIDKEKLKYEEPETKFLPLRKEVQDALQIYINSSKKLKEKDFLFRKFSLSYLKKKIKLDCKKASINKKFSLHGFRHYFISMCKKANMSNEDIAKWTGHIDSSTVNRYNQLTPEDVRGKVEKVDL